MRATGFLISRVMLSAIFAAALPTAAAEQVLTFDAEATQVVFKLKATGENVEGLFRLETGEIRFDTATGDAAGEVVVSALSAESGSKKRDKTMHKKVLESAIHPTIVFRPDRIEGELAPTGASEVALHGALELLGSEHEVTMRAQVEIEGSRVKAVTAFDIPFVEWGLHDPSFFILKVAKTVDIEISAEGTLAQAETDTASEAGR